MRHGDYFPNSLSWDGLRETLHTFSVAMVVLDPNTLEICECNSSVLELYEYEKKELLGMDITILFAERTQFLQKCQLVGALGRGQKYSHQHLSKHGEVRDVNVQLIPLRIEGVEYLCLVMRVKDDSCFSLERHQFEKTLFFEDFVRELRHGLNNQLMSVLTLSELMLSEGNVSSVLREDLENIHRAGGEMSKVVEALSLFPRDRSEDMRVVDVNQWLLQIFPQLQKIFESWGRLSLDLEEKSVGLSVRMDVTKCQEMLLDLVKNARESISAEGKVIICTRLFSKGIVQIQVRDEGRGVSNEDQTRVFDPFFSTKETGRFRGLGLFKAWKTMLEHGGSLGLESEEGVGTQIFVNFPKVSASLERTPKKAFRRSPSL